jgi:hypothetical protein
MAEGRVGGEVVVEERAKEGKERERERVEGGETDEMGRCQMSQAEQRVFS